MAAVASSRLIVVQGAGDDERLAGERPRRLDARRRLLALHVDAGRGQLRDQRAVLRLVREARTDAATTGPMSGTVCSCSTDASRIAVIVRR